MRDRECVPLVAQPAGEDRVIIFWREDEGNFPGGELRDVPRSRAAELCVFAAVLREGSGFCGPPTVVFPAELIKLMIAVGGEIRRELPDEAPRFDLLFVEERNVAIQDMFSMLLCGQLGTPSGLLAMIVLEDYLLAEPQRQAWMALVARHANRSTLTLKNMVRVCLHAYLRDISTARTVLLDLVCALETHTMGEVERSKANCAAVAFEGNRALYHGLKFISRTGWCCPLYFHMLSLVVGDLLWNTRSSEERGVAVASNSLYCIHRTSMGPMRMCRAGFHCTPDCGCTHAYGHDDCPITRQEESAISVLAGKFSVLGWLDDFLGNHRNNAIIAGGAVTAAVHRAWDARCTRKNMRYGWPGHAWESRDVDVFLYGTEHHKMCATVAILAYVTRHHPHAKCAQRGKCIDISINGGDARVENGKICWPEDAIVVQVVHSSYSTAQDVLLHFDQTYLQWGYNGKCTFGTLEAWMGFSGANWYTGSQIINKSMDRRALEATKRGMAFPRESLFLGTLPTSNLGYFSESPTDLLQNYDEDADAYEEDACPLVGFMPFITSVDMDELPTPAEDNDDFVWTHTPFWFATNLHCIKNAPPSGPVTTVNVIRASYRSAYLRPLGIEFATIHIDLGIVECVDVIFPERLMCVYLDVGKAVAKFNKFISDNGIKQNTPWCSEEETPEMLDAWRDEHPLAGMRPRHLFASDDGVVAMYLEHGVEWYGDGRTKPHVMNTQARTGGEYCIHSVLHPGVALMATGIFKVVNGSMLFVATCIHKAGDTNTDQRLAALIRARRAAE